MPQQILSGMNPFHAYEDKQQGVKIGGAMEKLRIKESNIFQNTWELNFEHNFGTTTVLVGGDHAQEYARLIADMINKTKAEIPAVIPQSTNDAFLA